MTARRAAGIFASVIVLAGCGSTVAPTGGTTDVAVGARTLSVQQPKASNDGATRVGGSGSPAAGTAVPLSASHGVGAHAGGTVTSAGRLTTVNTPGTSGPGVSASTITIGVTYYQSARSANAALGAKGVDTGDPVAGTRILIDWINKVGGVAGRRLVPVFYGVDPQSATPYATEAQAECTDFTEDNKVLAVIDGTPALDARACLAQHGVADFRGSMITAAIAPNEVDAYTTTVSRAFTAMVSALSRDSWFGGWNRVTAQPGAMHAKTGIVTPDSIDENRAVDQVLIPALRAAGYAPDPADVIRIAAPGGFGDDGATVAAIDNAVLKLNADGVDHVILNDDNGSLSLLFNNYAYSQGYFPRYGGTSGNAWQVLLAAGDIQPETLRGAMGIGWQPLFDVPYGNTQGDGAFDNAARRSCFNIFHRGGMPHANATTAGADAEGCDVMLLLPTLFHGYAGPINLQTLLNRVNALGSSYLLASGFASWFAPDQHDGTGAFATMHFVDACRCVQYSGRPEQMPR